MPGADGLDVIKFAREKDLDTRFILISGFKQFEYAYNAIKYDADDYILKPVEEEALNDALKKVIDDINSKKQDSARSSLHSIFISNSQLEELAAHPRSIDDLNISYALNFVDGRFRIVQFKLDNTKDIGLNEDDKTELAGKICEELKKTMKDICTEVIVEIHTYGVMCLINYETEEDSNVIYVLKTLHSRLSNEIIKGRNI